MKKDRYYTDKTISKKAHEMLKETAAMRARHRFRLEPKKSALLIIDMQRYFLEDSSHAFIPSAEAICAGIKKLIGYYRRMTLPLFFTRHVNTDTNAAMLHTWWQDVIKNGPASEITPELDVAKSTVITKHQYDAFYQTPLEEMLRKKGITQLVLCGVMTHLCCETTARSAFVRGFEVFFTVDGTATYNEAFHRATLLNLAHGFAVPVLVDEIVDALRQPHAG
jgi:isochorismate hydrolase